MKRANDYPLDNEWWNTFLEHSSGMSKPALFKNALSCEQQDWFARALLDLISTRTKDDSSNLRLYIEGNLMNTGYLYDNFFPNLPDGQEGLLEWLQRTFGDGKTALFVNHCELMAGAIPTAIVRYLNPLLAKMGLPCNGIQIDVIIGDYGYTPFGIHRDNIGDQIFHFHLGPATKIMYTWETGYYLDTLHGRQNEQNIEAFLPFGRKFEITGGDLYFMPWTEYHVGHTEGISMSITVTVQSGTKTNLMSNILKQISADLLATAEKGHLLPEKNPASPAGFSRLANELQHNPLWNEYSFHETLKLTYDKFLLKLGSNCGIQSAAPPKEQPDTPIPRDWFANRSIAINDPFPIYWREQPESQMEIYARGYDFRLGKDHLLETIIRKLNEGGNYTGSSLLENTDDGAGKPALHLLNKLYQLNAIVVE